MKRRTFISMMSVMAAAGVLTIDVLNDLVAHDVEEVKARSVLTC